MKLSLFIIFKIKQTKLTTDYQTSHKSIQILEK